MNSLQGNIANIETSGNLSIVSVEVEGGTLMKAIVIETPESASYIEQGRKISMLFKETEVIIGTGENQSISLQNKLRGRITAIEQGTLLSRIVLDTAAGEIVSVISSNAVRQLGLAEGGEATAMIKLNEVMLSDR